MNANSHLMLTTEEVADILRVSASTLRRWRSQGKGPPFVPLAGTGSTVRYNETELRRWMRSDDYGLSPVTCGR
jgi:excisionase family DNA binding protein